jgi:hypothetical protein
MSLRPMSLDTRLGTRPGARSLLRAVRALSFWSAIGLPFVYLPILAVGLDTPTRSVAFLALLALNVVALVVSHSYRPSE